VHTDDNAPLDGIPEGPEAQALAAAAWDEKRARAAAGIGHPVRPAAPSAAAAGTRARVMLTVDREGRLGQFRPGTHTFVPMSTSALAHPRVAAVLGALPPLPGLGAVELRTDGARVVLSAWSPRAGKGARNRHNQGVSAGVRGALAGLDLPGLGLAGVALDGRVLAGDATLHVPVGPFALPVGPASFFQVHLDLGPALVGAVGAAVRAVAPTAVLDLYAGAGALSLPLAAAGLPCVLIEENPGAAADARRTARARGWPAEVRTGDAGAFRAGDAFFDVVILDPPRAGAPGLLPELALTRPKAIVYVSCHPPALARDLAPLRAQGWTLHQLDAFDLFPQTPHLELLAVLTPPVRR
jgi:23S rRNA (uracil1939-C5)-methyltransferase